MDDLFPFSKSYRINPCGLSSSEIKVRSAASPPVVSFLGRNVSKPPFVIFHPPLPVKGTRLKTPQKIPSDALLVSQIRCFVFDPLSPLSFFE